MIAEGFDQADFDAITAAVKAASALPYVIGPKRSPIKSSSGATVTPAHHLEGFRSTMVDAIFIPSGKHVEILRKNGRAVHWVREAFGHCKALGATGEGVDLIREACSTLADSHVKIAGQSATEVVESYGVVTAGKMSPSSIGDVYKIAKEAKDFIGQFFLAISMHRNFDRELDGLVSQLAW